MEIRRRAGLFDPFSVKLGEVEQFPASHVIYISVAGGEEDLQRMYRNLNAGRASFREPFPYHPHITLAQNITEETSNRLLEVARGRWAAWTGPREFLVDSLSFVQNVSTDCWTDLETVELGRQPVS